MKGRKGSRQVKVNIVKQVHLRSAKEQGKGSNGPFYGLCILLPVLLLFGGGLASYGQYDCGQTDGNLDVAIDPSDSTCFLVYNGIKISFLIILSLASFCQITAVLVDGTVPR